MGKNEGEKLHEREAMVRGVTLAIEQTVADRLNEADLTVGERVRVLTDVFGRLLGSIAKYMIRYERHGDPAKPGGLEG